MTHAGRCATHCGQRGEAGEVVRSEMNNANASSTSRAGLSNDGGQPSPHRRTNNKRDGDAKTCKASDQQESGRCL